MYSQSQTVSIQQKIQAVIRLTRWREHVPYTIPIVVAGALMAANSKGIIADWRILPVLFANILAMAFAFMINDIVDAPDDAQNPVKKKNNAIASGLLRESEAYTLTIGTFMLSLALFALGGWKTFAAGGVTLVLCYLYSAKPFRLKARPIVDVLSHVLMLAGLLMLSGYLIYDAYPKAAWLVIIAVTFGSAYGQFYNQLDDFDTDKQAGLNNTAMLLGEGGTRFAMIASLLIAIGSFIGAIALGLFPSWLGTITLIVGGSMLLFRWQHDMRGNQADVSGTFQQPILLSANIVVLIWAAGHLGFLTGIV